MKKHKVMQYNNLPGKIPIYKGLVGYLTLEHFNSPSWLYGAVGLFFLLVFLNNIANIILQEKIDLVGNNENN